MSVTKGTKLPQATFIEMGEDGPQEISGATLFNGRKVVVFGVPGAFSTTCDQAHLPSFIAAAETLRDKGVDEICCVAVNDPFVMKAWGDSKDAAASGIRMLSDADGAFTRAIGMEFDAPPIGFYGRSKRYALVAQDGEVTEVQIEEDPGACEVSGGQRLADAL